MIDDALRKGEMKVVILHSDVPPDAPQDEQDVLIQSECVAASLRRAGHEAQLLPFTLELGQLAERLRRIEPDLVFNLMESVGGKVRFTHMASTLLDYLGIPYTGCSTAGLLITTDKLLTKRQLRLAGLPTPSWYSSADGFCGEFRTDQRYILKSVYEDGSIGIDDGCVRCFGSIAEIASAIAASEDRFLGRAFAEEYIEGREFNLALCHNPLFRNGCDGVQVLPPSEIVFEDFPPGKPRIVGYPAKWHEDSFEYTHTVNRLDFCEADKALIGEMSSLAKQCWRLFELSGYARVDFRIDERGRPWILEVNANPCIAPDAGFMKCAAKAGYSFDQTVLRIAGSPYRPG